MKKCCILFAFLFILFMAAALTALPREQTPPPSAYIRLHVRANSDGDADQAVKYAVKDALVDYLMPVAASCGSKEEAQEALAGALGGIVEVYAQIQSLGGIEAAAERALAEQGFTYGARASLRKEQFPARVYEGVTLPAGVYDALIVELGAGEGANWWCVVYPPLCFSGAAAGGGVRLRSRLLDIIRDFFAG